MRPATIFLLLFTAMPAWGQERKIEFNRDIRPILSDNCFLCHGPAKGARKAGLRLDSEEGAMAELKGHKAIVPGKLEESHLWLRVSSSDPAKRMPPPKSGRDLSAHQIATLKLWIEQGAKWERHWSFLPPRRAAPPEVREPGLCKNPIDRFVLARLQQEGLHPSPEASRETLIRRVTLDLTGLPPTIKEIDAFLGDKAPDAYEKVVDRLLASPRYGERMVLEWLDAARYADTNGYQTDGTRPMWPWRDWVVDALNKNMPFDQFTVEQIAGDMLPNPTVSQKIATGFHRNHMLNGEGGRIAEESRVDYVVDRVDTTFTVWLGLTAGCARCHDHKYDPLPQKEYYQLFAYWNSIAETGGVDRRNSTAAPVIELPTGEQTKKIEIVSAEVKKAEADLKTLSDPLLSGEASWEKDRPATLEIPDSVKAAIAVEIGKRTPEQKKIVTEFYLNSFPERKKLQTALDKSKKELTEAQNAVLITMVMEERKEPRETFVLVRGIYDKHGDKVAPGLPKVLPPLAKDVPNNRLGLARWLVDKSNPLTARVTVNRAWQLFFGAGLVKTSEDFGAQGESPSHPELLDWLAAEFMAPERDGATAWDVKALHRLIVTSATYRQKSQASAAAMEKDPVNRLLTRGPRSRLNSLLLRDQALALSGLLVEKVGGPPVKPYQPPGLWEDFSFNQIKYVQDKGDKLYRRSLYTFWRRSIGPPNLFDTSARQVCMVRQPRTNTPLHALTLLNDVTFVEAARVWAERLMKEGGATPEQRLRLAFRTATARQPTQAEEAVLLKGFARVRRQYQDDKTAALKLVSAGEFPRDASLDVAELAAYAAMANMILNLDEVLAKE